MTSGSKDRPERPAGRDEFDTTAELWDRIVDDISRQGQPCLETVEKLVDEACRRLPGPGREAPGQD